MEDVQGPRTDQTAQVVIDRKTLDYLKDRMLELFHEYPGGEDLFHRCAFTALRDHIIQRGGTPGFEVKL